MTQDRKSMDMEKARAEVYTFFAGVFQEPPSAGFIDILLRPRGLEVLEKLFGGHPALDECRDLAEDYAGGKWNIEDFQLDFDGLFRVPGAQFVHPFESVYRQRESTNRSPGKSMLLGEQAREVARIYREEGLSPASTVSAFPDELGVELEFMGRLCNRAAAALELKETERAAAASAGQYEFLRTHLLNWGFACLRTVVRNADTPLYRVLAELLASFLEQERQAMEGGAAGCSEVKEGAAC